MAIDRNSNAFTFGFAIAMVIVVGSTLAILVTYLRPFQEKNAKDKTMISILGAINVDATRENAQELFDKYIKLDDSFILNSEGEVIERGKSTFDVDIKKEYKDKTIAVADRQYPLYIGDKDGDIYYIMPMAGAGLWGPIWGYAAVGEDQSTFYGVRFNHKAETPGLGAEISSYSKFQEQWEGKKMRNPDGSFHPILVSKTPSDPNNVYAVDGITGGTITSKDLEEMVNRSLSVYAKYFNSSNNQPVE
jgi:Na+-transporting NADH:ubiquinone oxidoreductase subunit C